MSQVLTLYYDTISPYSIFAFTALMRYKSLWDVDIRLRPVYLSKIMQLSRNKPPGLVPAKGSWMMKDLPRNAALFGEEGMLRMPKNFFAEAQRPTIQRLLAVTTARESADALQQATRAAFDLRWKDTGCRDAKGNIDISDEKLKLITAACVTPHEELLALAQGDESKALLQANTDEAVALGCFGVPFVVVSEEGKKPVGFFGSDRLEQLAYHLGKPYHGAHPTASKL